VHSVTLARRLAQLRELGFRLAVDGPGAGRTMASGYREIMPEVVKLDGSLVRNVENCAWKQRTIIALCQQCHDLGALVIADGVKTGEARDALVDLGCDLLQGDLIGRPSRWLPR
jgi:EAL domain-containing protein (putative c-di-GMP-specific phosphodiesterase class I)